MLNRYEEIDHAADIAARIYGEDLQDILKNAAICLFELMADRPGGGVNNTAIIEAEAEDTESLLIKWLNELLFASFEHKTLFYDVDALEINNNKLKARVSGPSYEGKENFLKNEIKAATYHDVKIAWVAGRYEVVVVFDV